MPISALQQNPQPGKPDRPILAVRGVNRPPTVPHPTAQKLRYALSTPGMTRATSVAMRPTFATNKPPCNFLMDTEPPGSRFLNRGKQVADKVCIIEMCYFGQ